MKHTSCPSLRDINDLAEIGKALVGMVEDQGDQINVFGIYTILPYKVCSVKVILPLTTEVNVATAQNRVKRGRRELREVRLSSGTGMNYIKS